jgi:hypothetical protein
MTHDPLCEFNFVLREVGDCQRCDLIARVRMDEREKVLRDAPVSVFVKAHTDGKAAGYDVGRADALAEARDAVAALKPTTTNSLTLREEALDAIDALRGES